jgi:hypothetical protein
MTMTGEDTETIKENGEERNLGTQPMDAILTEHGIANSELVTNSKDPITHKAVQRARKGRKLTRRMQQRMVAATNAVLKLREVEQVMTLPDLFTYKA